MWFLRRFITAALLLASFALFPFNAAAWDRGNVEQFATLPNGFGNPRALPSAGTATSM